MTCPHPLLTHWGRVTHICVGKLAIIASDNGLSPERRQAIIWTNARILLIGPLGTNFSEILIEIQIFSLKEIRLNLNVVCEIFTSFRPQCVNTLKPGAYASADLVITGPFYGLAPIRRLDILKAELLKIGPSEQNLSDFWLTVFFIQKNAFQNVCKCRHFLAWSMKWKYHHTCDIFGCFGSY